MPLDKETGQRIAEDIKAKRLAALDNLGATYEAVAGVFSKIAFSRKRLTKDRDKIDAAWKLIELRGDKPAEKVQGKLAISWELGVEEPESGIEVEE